MIFVRNNSVFAINQALKQINERIDALEKASGVVDTEHLIVKQADSASSTGDSSPFNLEECEDKTKLIEYAESIGCIFDKRTSATSIKEIINNKLNTGE